MRGWCDRKVDISTLRRLSVLVFVVFVFSVLACLLSQTNSALAVPQNQHGVWDGTSNSYNYNHPQQYKNPDDVYDPPGDVDPPNEEASSYSDGCDRCHDMMGGETFALPHGRYSTATNRCRDCHAVHRASGSFVLTRANDEYTACEYCHGSGAGSGRKIQMADPGVSNGHHLGYTGYAPDTDQATPYSVVGFTCHDCHSVHANRKRMVKSILQHSPGQSDSYSPKAPPHKGALLLGRPNHENTSDHAFCAQDVDLSDWCSACHEGNGGINNGGGVKDHKTVMTVYDNITDSWDTGYSHDCQTNGMALNGLKYLTCDTQVADAAYPQVNTTDGINKGPSCHQCHNSDWISEYPHRSDSYVLLKSGASDTALDNVCLDCHKSDALP